MYLGGYEKRFKDVRHEELADGRHWYECALCGEKLYSHGPYGNGPWPSEAKIEARFGPNRGCCEKYRCR